MTQQTAGRIARCRGARRRARRAAAVSLVAGVLLAPLLAGAGAAADGGTGDGPGSGKDRGPEPIDFAVVVDQSASLSEKDLAREVEAAALISQGEISNRSRAMVIGFGSAEKDGQSAVDQVCDLTVADATGRQELSDCVQRLAHPDRDRIGPGTDFPAAVRQATDRLTEDTEGARAATPKVVFLLTDGKLDVGDSPNYGKGDDPATRQKYGQKALDEELSRARREKVMIWPLGFGSKSAIDEKALRGMAAGGYRNGCAHLPDATPRMRVVDESAQLERALQQTFAKARCARVEQGTAGKPPGDLHVSIPPIATDGSITVTKRDPQVHATYYDPKGRKVPTAGSKYGSRFELSGQKGPVEALRVKNPTPGKWRVHLEAPEDHRGQEASVSAIWQGRLRSMVNLTPPSPRPGEQAVIEAWMQTRDDVVINDSDQLDGVRASARLEGDGFDPVEVRLRDDGEQTDKRAGDVRFTGKVTIPESATGALRITSEMAAPGVSGDERPYHTRLLSGQRALKATATVDGTSVHPGGTVDGTLTAANNDDRTHTLRLELEGRREGDVRISPATVRVPPGSSEPIPYKVSFGKGTPLGEAGGRIVVVDTTDKGSKLDDTPLYVTVEAPPTWWDAWWWAVVTGTAVALLAALVIVVRIRAGRNNRDTSGLVLELCKDGRVMSRLRVRSGRGQGHGFDFTVDVRATRPGLRAGRGGGRPYRLTRDPSGSIRIRPPEGQERAVRVGGQLSLGEGLDLVVLGRRSAGSTRPPRPGRGGGGTPTAPRPRTPGEGDGGESAPSAAGSGRQYDPNF